MLGKVTEQIRSYNTFRNSTREINDYIEKMNLRNVGNANDVGLDRISSQGNHIATNLCRIDCPVVVPSSQVEPGKSLCQNIDHSDHLKLTFRNKQVD